MDYQITLFDKSNKYKPVSAVITKKAEDTQATLIKRGAEKICLKRGWTSADLKRFGYTTVKIRVYDKEKLDKEAEERYNKIKEEKYASGEWKRPKKKDTP